MNANQILEREYLSIRAKILELAACFDRIERADGDVSDAPEMVLIRQALDVLIEHQLNRAEQVQMLFSHPYRKNWQAEFQVSNRS